MVMILLLRACTVWNLAALPHFHMVQAPKSRIVFGIKNGIFREVGIQNVLIELEEKLLQWFSHVKRMDRTRIPT
jgi:hypothetical protein